MSELTVDTVRGVVREEVAPLKTQINRISITLNGDDNDRDDLGVVGDVAIFKRGIKWMLGIAAVVMAAAIVGSVAAVFNTIIAARVLEAHLKISNSALVASESARKAVEQNRGKP